MKAPGKGRPATRWVLVVGLQLLSVLSLQSCKKDQTESAKREAQPPQQRAVFGSTPESVRSEIPPQTPKMAAKPTAEASRSRERAPTTKPFDSKSRATSPLSLFPARPNLPYARESVRADFQLTLFRKLATI
jgi:hypothetical protein